MSDTIRATLLALKDVQGVEGGFVLAAQGTLLAMEMPPLFDAEMFSDLGPRIERLSESFASLGDDLESCMVRFSDHVLCVKRFAKGGALCVLAAHSVNLPALRMAMNLADRRLAGSLNGTASTNGTAGSYSAASISMTKPPQPPTPVIAQPAAAPERKIPRYYRGHLVED
jgi:predicted regulator of Ras-like GTPase activity (Roadblock/LC7/MglB family)